jgi:hypothetical protein
MKVQLNGNKVLLSVEGANGNLNILLNDNFVGNEMINSEDRLNALKIEVLD